MRLPLAFANKRIGALDSLLLRICRKLGIGKTVRQVQQVVLKKTFSLSTCKNISCRRTCLSVLDSASWYYK